MKLTTTTQVSVDGVMQGSGGPDEDRKGEFERGGWAMGHVDNEARTFVVELYQRADAFLFGRWTFELFAGYWGGMEAGSHPIADALNTRPKYLASSTLTNPQWGGHDRPLRRRRGRCRRAESQARRRAASAQQRQADSLAP
jgi:hypothetical protein